MRVPTTTRMAAELAKICRICRYADGVCTAGFRKTHERADPMCRLHRSTSRGLYLRHGQRRVRAQHRSRHLWNKKEKKSTSQSQWGKG